MLVSAGRLASEHEASWRALSARALEPNPFFEPDFVIPALEHFPSTRDISFVVAHDGADFRACLPVRPVDRWVDWLPALTTRFWDMDPPPGAPGGPPLVDAADTGDTVEALLRALSGGRTSGLPGVLVLERLVHDGPVTAHISERASAGGLPVRVQDRWQRAVLDRGPGQDWTSALAPGILKKVGRRRRRLAEQLGDQVRLVDRSADPDAVEDLLSMEASGWKGRADTDARSSPLDAHFRDSCDRFRAAGRLDVVSLESAGKCLAMRSSLRAGNEYFTLRKVYDEEYAAFGPGVLLDVEFTRHMLSRPDVRRVHLMHGPSYQEHNSRIFRASTEVCTMVIATGSSFDGARVRALPAVSAVRQLAHRARHQLRARRASLRHASTAGAAPWRHR